MTKPNIQIWDIEKITPYPNNSKIHDKEQVSKIANSIKEFGWTQPIVIDKSGVIIAGHGRRLAAIELGQTKIPVWVRDDLDENQVRALRLADNRVAQGKIDTDLFKLELSTLEFDLSGFFDSKEIDFAIADLGAMNTDAFVDDIASAIQEQEASAQEKVSAISEKPVPVARVLGFKEVRGSNQLAVSRFMSELERIYGVKGEEAFVQHAIEFVSKS